MTGKDFQLDSTTPTEAIVTTKAVTNMNPTTAQTGGNVTSDGGASITAKGVCWSTNANPTTSNGKTTDGNGIGSFDSSITGLIAGASYHVRAYATNSVGTAYGNDISFNTPYVAALYVSTVAGCGGNNPCYNSIQNAINDAVTGSLIKISGGIYSGPITLNQVKSLTLQGGWDSSFSLPKTEITTLKEVPKGPQGSSLTMQELSIKP